MSASAWGDQETRFFFELTPERILAAVERSGLRCTGRCLPLHCMENRVYEVEIEVDEAQPPARRSDHFRIVKFYRPGRWSQAQILEEHVFLADLVEAEVPVVAPTAFADGRTLHTMTEVDISYAMFPKIGGRSPDEMTDDQLAQVGRLLARLHAVGAARPAPQRIPLDPATYGLRNLSHLVDSGALPPEIRARYVAAVEDICRLSEPLFGAAEVQRVHGDCHLGNLLWGPDGPFWVDFDDMVRGPCVQDLWLVVPGRDEEAVRQRELMLAGYEQMRRFDRRTLRLIEPLRALRFVHFAAWIARRWHDPAFPRAFPAFGTPRYWQEQLVDMEEQRALIEGQDPAS